MLTICLRRELRELSSDKFALEQEVKLGSAQRLVQRKDRAVKGGTMVLGLLILGAGFFTYALACAIGDRLAAVFVSSAMTEVQSTCPHRTNVVHMHSLTDNYNSAPLRTPNLANAVAEIVASLKMHAPPLSQARATRRRALLQGAALLPASLERLRSTTRPRPSAPIGSTEPPAPPRTAHRA